MSRLPRRSNSAEILAFEEVCQRLGGFARSISWEFADGYLAALAAGPRLPPQDEWIGGLCGDAFDRAFADPDDRAHALRALKARLAVLQDQLDAEALYDDLDALRLEPLMAEWTEAERGQVLTGLRTRGAPVTAEDEAQLHTGAEWAQGFDAAADHFADLWTEPAADDEQAPLYAELRREVRSLYEPRPAAAVAAAEADAVAETVVDPDPTAAADAGAAADDAVDRDALITDACYAVQDLRLWWVERAPVPETRRVAPTPGRNDPCPCGSGKKFKKCHGA